MDIILTYDQLKYFLIHCKGQPKRKEAKLKLEERTQFIKFSLEGTPKEQDNEDIIVLKKQESNNGIVFPYTL